MRIAFWVRVGNKYGGMEKYIALFAETCKEQGYDFLLINEIENTTKEYCDRLSNAGAEQVVVGESLQSPLIVYIKVMKHLQNWKADIVQMHFINSLAIPLLKIYGVPLIYQTCHTGIDHEISLRTRFFRNINNIFAKRVFAVSERVRQDEIRAGTNPDHIEKMPLGLRLSDFEEPNLALEGSEPPELRNAQYRKIITVGRFFPVKGMRYVVDAAITVIRERTDVIWWLVGKEGPESEVCKQIIQSAKMQDRILILGQRNDIPALFKHCDFQVVGSLSEGFGLMAAEAAVCGIPTIGTRIGGLDEAILDGETGLLVEVGSADALAQATLWLMDHPEECVRMGKAAFQHVTENFNSEKQIANLLEVFTQDYEARTKRGR
jgi:glycosyltransferase involved in cell wall biosynthesis